MTDEQAPAGSPLLAASTLSRFHELLEERTGLQLDDRRSEALAEAVREVGAQWDLPTAEAVLQACLPSSGLAVFEAIVARLTVGETYFFRVRPHFQALSEVVFPELLERREGPLRIWSAGCATGEETYSLAMTLDQTARRLGVDLAAREIELVGTDIDRAALQRAAAGEYGKYSFRGVTAEERAEHFEDLGDGRFLVKQRYRDMVSFRHLNLRSDPFPSPQAFHDVDLVVCRNVTIYFSPEATRALADKFFETLREGGYLLVGHAEHSLETYRRFQARPLPETILYQRGGERAREAPSHDLRSLLHAPLGHRAATSVLKAGPVLRGRSTAADVPSTFDSGAEAPTLAAARAALAAGDVNGAVSVAVDVLEGNPADADASLFLGQLAADRGHLAEARMWLAKTLELRPLDEGAHYLQAIVALGRGEAKAALASLDRALYVEPDFVLAHYLRARVLREAGDGAASERSLRTALAILEGSRDTDEVPFAEGLTVAQLRSLLAAAPGERP